MGGMVKSEATGNMVFGLGNVVQQLGHLIHQPVCNSDRSVRGDWRGGSLVGAWAGFVWLVFALYSVPIKIPPR